MSTTHDKQARTDVDKRILLIIDAVMRNESINSDRQMSKLLGMNEQFLNKVRTGAQSVPQEVIQILIRDYNASGDHIYTGEGTPFRRSKKDSDPYFNIPNYDDLSKEELIRRLIAYDMEVRSLRAIESGMRERVKYYEGLCMELAKSSK